MSTETTNPARLAELNRLIEHLETDAPRLESERAARAKAARRADRKWRYMRLARTVRSPAKSFEMWSMGLLVVGPFVVGLVTFILSNRIVGSVGFSFLAFLIGAAASALAFAALLFRPGDDLLPAEFAAAESERREIRARLEEAIHATSASKTQLAELIEERRQLMASGKVQRAALLQREWKSMPAAEWEDFVVEVLRTLGATVERSPRNLDGPTALVAHFANRRVAILTTGEGQVVNSGTVQHAVAAQRRHSTDASAIVLNRRFSGAAQDYAHRNQCTLVGTEQFPDFVMGKLEI